MLPYCLLRGALCSAEEELCTEVRASWGVVTALNQAILCSCLLDAFMSGQGLLLKHGYAGWGGGRCSLHFQMCGYFQLVLPTAHMLPAARKEAPAEVSREVVF